MRSCNEWSFNSSIFKLVTEWGASQMSREKRALP